MRTKLGTTSLIALGLFLLLAADDSSGDVASDPPGDCNHDGVADADEIAANPVLDANFNGLPDRCEGLSVDRLALSVSEGGTQRFVLELGPAMAGRIYWLLGTSGGTEPGSEFGFVHLPLNHDGPAGYMPQTLQRPNEDELGHSLGVLDAQGRAEATFTLAPNSDPGLAGAVAHHAFVLIDATSTRTPIWASNAVSLALVP